LFSKEVILMDQKVRGWLAVIAALVVGYIAWSGKAEMKWAVLILALLLLISGYHHLTTKHKK
jgi:hypothetical protein